MCARAEGDELGVGDHRTEVGHCADDEENERHDNQQRHGSRHFDQQPLPPALGGPSDHGNRRHAAGRLTSLHSSRSIPPPRRSCLPRFVLLAYITLNHFRRGQELGLGRVSLFVGGYAVYLAATLQRPPTYCLGSRGGGHCCINGGRIESGSLRSAD